MLSQSFASAIAISGVLVLVGQFPVLAAPCECAEKIGSCEGPEVSIKEKRLVFTSKDLECQFITYEIDGERNYVTFKGGHDDSTEYLKSNPNPKITVKDCNWCKEPSKP
jgi:hypothetical protein